MLEFLSRIRPKEIEPKLYTIVLADGPIARKLWVGFAYTFEEAFDLARDEAVESFPEEAEAVPYWKPIIWDSLDGRDMVALALEADVIQPPRAPKVTRPKTNVAPPKQKFVAEKPTQKRPKIQKKKTPKKKVVSTKNQMIKALISKKSVRALNLVKGELSTAEYKYIYDEIKNKK